MQKKINSNYDYNATHSYPEKAKEYMCAKQFSIFIIIFILLL